MLVLQHLGDEKIHLFWYDSKLSSSRVQISRARSRPYRVRFLQVKDLSKGFVLDLHSAGALFAPLQSTKNVFFFSCNIFFFGNPHHGPARSAALQQCWMEEVWNSTAHENFHEEFFRKTHPWKSSISHMQSVIPPWIDIEWHRIILADHGMSTFSSGSRIHAFPNNYIFSPQYWRFGQLLPKFITHCQISVTFLEIFGKFWHVSLKIFLFLFSSSSFLKTYLPT